MAVWSELEPLFNELVDHNWDHIQRILYQIEIKDSSFSSRLASVSKPNWVSENFLGGYLRGHFGSADRIMKYIRLNRDKFIQVYSQKGIVVLEAAIIYTIIHELIHIQYAEENDENLIIRKTIRILEECMRLNLVSNWDKKLQKELIKIIDYNKGKFLLDSFPVVRTPRSF
jgi:hypothetical protein